MDKSYLQRQFVILMFSVRYRMLEDQKEQPDTFNVNCVDPLNRSALIAAIENENIDLIRLLLDFNIKVKVSCIKLSG